MVKFNALVRAVTIIGIGMVIAYAFVQLVKYTLSSIPPGVYLVVALLVFFSIFDAIALLASLH